MPEKHQQLALQVEPLELGYEQREEQEQNCRPLEHYLTDDRNIIRRPKRKHVTIGLENIIKSWSSYFNMFTLLQSIWKISFSNAKR